MPIISVIGLRQDRKYDLGAQYPMIILALLILSTWYVFGLGAMVGVVIVCALLRGAFR